jgi:hypothetical protein
MKKVGKRPRVGKHPKNPAPECSVCGVYMTSQSVKIKKGQTTRHTSWICLGCGAMVLDEKKFKELQEREKAMNRPTIQLDLEKVLNMIVQNADNHQNGLGMADGRIVINAQNNVEYLYPSPGTYFLNAHEINPEELIFMDDVERVYPLDLVEFMTTAKDNVSQEKEKPIEEFTDDDWADVQEYTNEWIDEWEAEARGNQKDVLTVTDSCGEIIAEYNIEWVEKQ